MQTQKNSGNNREILQKHRVSKIKKSLEMRKSNIKRNRTVIFCGSENIINDCNEVVEWKAK